MTFWNSSTPTYFHERNICLGAIKYHTIQNLLFKGIGEESFSQKSNLEKSLLFLSKQRDLIKALLLNIPNVYSPACLVEAGSCRFLGIHDLKAL